MTVEEYCNSCQNKGSHKCHSCCGKFYDGVLQCEPTKYIKKPQTNADRIRAMSDEELAKWLCDISTAECCDRSCPARGMCDIGDNGMIKWLKQPAGEA